MKRMIAAVLLAMMTTSVFAGTTSLRDASTYFLGSSAMHIVTTNPPQPFEPVYSWRTHVRFDGSPGTLGYNGTYIGNTDANGTLRIVVPQLPLDPVYCGRFHNERVAVGSRNNPRSNRLSFSIEIPLFGPLPPWVGQCTNRFIDPRDDGSPEPPVDD